MGNFFVKKTITVRKDQSEWLKKDGRHINLSALTQKAIDEEMAKNKRKVV